MTPKVLFVLKETYPNDNYKHAPAGLINSATFVKNALIDWCGIESKLVKVIDGNFIDREVHQYKPTHVMVEALWTTPDKIKELSLLYPKIQWIIRVHSKTTFLANEGIAIEWIQKLTKINDSTSKSNVKVAFNNYDTFKEFANYLSNVIYLPNIYCPKDQESTWNPEEVHDIFKENGTLHIGCFGAIRPLKNQLIQAMAAIQLADSVGVKLYFHMNGFRLEQRGETVRKNIEALFEGTKHELIKWPWLDHEQFIKVVKKMNLGMQVSLSESFNIVTADFVDNNIPIVVGKDIDWMPRLTRTNPLNINSIIFKLKLVSIFRKIFTFWSSNKLTGYNMNSTQIWKDYLIC